jgi:predicted phosphodiesterase
MRFQYASDLHLEMVMNDAYMERYPLVKSGDILLLAGDIINLQKRQYLKSHFDTWSKNYDQVFIIPGNHEFYGKHFPIKQTFPSFKKDIRENVHYLNNKVIIIGDVRLIFTTLFSEISPEQSMYVKRYLNDFHVSRFNNDSNMSLTISEYNKSHIKCRVFLEEALSEPFSGKTIVVSHHVPYPSSYIEDYPKFAYDLSDAFHVDLIWLTKKYKVDHWISGHTHVNHKPIMIGETMFYTNQLGYLETDEHQYFNREAVIEV